MKIHYILLALISAALVPSCRKEQMQADGNRPYIEGEMTLNAIQESAKSHLGEAKDGIIPTCWDADDELCLFSQGSGTAKNKFTTTSSDISETGTSAKFHGTISGAAGPYCAVYPYSKVSSGSAGEIVLNVPQNQNYSADSFGSGANIAAACWESGNTASFKNLCGAIRIPLKGSKSVSKIVLTDKNSSAQLWGTCNISCDIAHNDFSSIKFTGGSNIVNLICSPAVQLKTGEDTDFYVVVPAGAFQTGFSIKVYDSSDAVIKTIETSNNFCIERSAIRVATDINLDSPFTYGGDGTNAKPYIIANAADLQNMASLVNSQNGKYGAAHYRQVRDINMSGLTINPAGTTKDNAFRGSYDGGNCTISNLTETVGSSNYCGLFGATDGATIRNVILNNVKLSSTPANSGALAGYCTDTAVENCSVTNSTLTSTVKGCGTVIGRLGGGTVKGCSSDAVLHVNVDGLCENAGIVGYLSEGTIENCTFSGKVIATGTISTSTRVTVAGQRVAGITSATGSANCTVRNCTVTEDAVIHAGKTEAGGITGLLGNGAKVEGCKVEGKITAEDAYAGGIAATLRQGSIKDCYVGGECNISAKMTSAGGIAGYVYYSGTASEYNIDNCLVCANIQGAARIGGIVGFYNIGAIDGDVLNITNCGFDGGMLTATINTTNTGDSEVLCAVGGIIGTCYTSTYNGTVNILNCWASPSCIRMRRNQVPYGSEAITYVTSPRIGGIVGDQVGSNATTTIAGCYCDMAKFQISYDGEELPDYDSSLPEGDPNKIKSHFGGLYGKSSTAITYDRDYCTLSIQYGPGYTGITNFKNCERLGNIAVTDGTLLGKLNSFKSSYSSPVALKSWVRGPEGHPVIDGGMTPCSSSKKRAPLRISVIGDSISTFIGWLPDGYHRYYPATASASLVGGMSLTRVSQTYWWRLAYDYMTNAMIDKNLSWSGSVVTVVKQKNFDEGGGYPTGYADGHGSNLHYYKRSFVERFISQNGMGNPDIIIVKGGTNDSGKTKWTGSAWKCADNPSDGSRNYNYSLYCYGTQKDRSVPPKASDLAAYFTKGDAATTYDKAKALPDDTFAESYIKLIRMCQTKYPKVKIVCIISDSITKSFADCALMVGNHYKDYAGGIKVVDLWRLDGKTEIYKNNLAMPKVDATDLSKNGNGCHPDPRGMEFVADKIYTELGTWLEGDPYSGGSSDSSNDDFTTTDGQWR